MVWIGINGHAATPTELRAHLVADPGHFTAFELRNRAIRGLNLHLDRLANASHELFGAQLDRGSLIDHLRHAVGDGIDDAAVRVEVYRVEPAGALDVMVTVRAPDCRPTEAVRLRTVQFVRPDPHLCRVGESAHFALRRSARTEGFDDSLLVTTRGVIAETTTANVGFLGRGRVIWAAGPAVAGTGRMLLDRQLTSRGWRTVQLPIAVDDLLRVEAGFVVSARGFTPIASVDDVALEGAHAGLDAIRSAFDAIPSTPLEYELRAAG